MPRTLEDVLALRDITSLKIRGYMKEIEGVLKRNSHLCYTASDIKIAVDYPYDALPLSFVMYAMQSKEEWQVEMPVKGWYRWSGSQE